MPLWGAGKMLVEPTWPVWLRDLVGTLPRVAPLHPETWVPHGAYGV